MGDLISDDRRSQRPRHQILLALFARSGDLISDNAPSDNRLAHREAIFEIVRQIPEGRVMTYGGVASLIPPPARIDFPAYSRIRARWVGYALKRCPEHLPWHRVVNAQGSISSRHGVGPALQRTLLEDEGVAFDQQGRLDLESLYWEPEPQSTS